MNKAWTAVLLGFLLVLAACGEASVATAEEPESTSPTTVETTEERTVEEVEDLEVEDTVPPLPSTTEPPPGVIAEVRCPANASCAEEFILNGKTYSLSCAAVLESAVLPDEVLGSGTAFSQAFEVFALSGNPSHDIVAVSIEGGRCSEDDTDEFVSPWSFAWTASADAGSAVCELGLLSDEQRIVDEC